MLKHILLIAALPEEANAFRPDEGRVLTGEPHPVRLIDQGETQIKIVTCGLGKVNAALVVGRYTDADTTLVAMTGTCGRIGRVSAGDFPRMGTAPSGSHAQPEIGTVPEGGQSPEEGDTFWIARAIQHDYGARGREGFTHYRAGDWPMGKGRDHAFTAMPDPGLGLPHATIASGDAFLECPDTAQALTQRLGAHLVDMEVAAVAQAAEALGLPWAAIKAVTDGADGESAGDFNANLLGAARRAGAAMERFATSVLDQGRAGAVG
jgi:adenosylhomocysteine nucleosidase